MGANRLGRIGVRGGKRNAPGSGWLDGTPATASRSIVGMMASVLMMAFLLSCSRGTRPQGDGAARTPTVQPTVEQVQDLVRKRDDQVLIRILCETSDWDVTQEIVYYFKDATDGGNLDLFRKSEAEIIRRHGKYPVANVYLSRSEKRGLLLMGEAFREFENEDDALTAEKLSSMVRGDLRAATGITFETADAYMQWVKKNISNITIEPGSGHPRVRVESTEDTPEE